MSSPQNSFLLSPDNQFITSQLDGFIVSPHHDFLLFSEEMNQIIHPSPVVTQNAPEENSALSNTVSRGATAPPSLQNLELSYFADHPLQTVEDHAQLMEMCLQSNNPEAHYIEGLKEYFLFKNSAKGLDHLRRSAEGHYNNGTYVYGLLLRCRGDHAQGKRFIGSLGWKDNKRRVDCCWRRVKRSLDKFKIVMKRRYLKNMVLLKPKKRCHTNDMDNRCRRCFYYKQVLKFIDFI